jgi:putative transposase
MGRALRVDLGGYVYHVLNRANARNHIFEDENDYSAFERVLRQAQDRASMRLLAWCIMPNHWHLVVHPRKDGDLSSFMRWLTLTHTQRWHAHRKSAGQGHLYQGRYKSFLVEEDSYLFTVCRYVERNALRAGLVDPLRGGAEDWRWGSLWWWVRRRSPDDKQPVLCDWPVDRPHRWRSWVNEPQTGEELEAVRRSVNRGRPLGSNAWVDRMIRRFGLEATERPAHRPRKDSQSGRRVPDTLSGGVGEKGS